MKSYNELTFRGQILRTRQLCLKALEDYPIEVARVRYLTTESTTMFRVDARDGQKYVIRLYSELDSSLAEPTLFNAPERKSPMRILHLKSKMPIK